MKGRNRLHLVIGLPEIDEDIGAVQPEPGPERAGAGDPGAQPGVAPALRTRCPHVIVVREAFALDFGGGAVALDAPDAVLERGGQGRAALVQRSDGRIQAEYHSACGECKAVRSEYSSSVCG